MAALRSGLPGRHVTMNATAQHLLVVSDTAPTQPPPMVVIIATVPGCRLRSVTGINAKVSD